uniref:Small ribosomal subunit protein uS8c n=1 Tax=Prasiolopsis wulf-kochii TaxID=3239232 RepID=A0A097KK01_9CHLO|nr:ribosomal protein S8 [Prasiolopsis sp. SAG 84.81]
MVNDTISDILTRIRNANLIKSRTVSIPVTRIGKQISEILEKQGFIESFEVFSLTKSKKDKNGEEAKLNNSLESQGSAGEKRETALVQKESQKLFKKNHLSTDGRILKKLQSKASSSSEKIIIYLKYQDRTKKPCITNLKRISRPGLRIYANYKEIPKVLGGMGIAILSTSKGIMTDREARFHKIGGEILCSIW